MSVVLQYTCVNNYLAHAIVEYEENKIFNQW